MGARIAAALAVYHPEAVSSLILADPPLTGPGRDPYPVPLDPYVDSLRKAQAGATADDMRPAFPTWPVEHLALRARWLGACAARRPSSRPTRISTPKTCTRCCRRSGFRCCSCTAPRVPSCPRAPCPSCERVASGRPLCAGRRTRRSYDAWDNLDDFVAVVLQFTDKRPQAAPNPVVDQSAARCQHVRIPQLPAASSLSPAVAAAAFEHAPIATAIVQITDGEPWILEVDQASATLRRPPQGPPRQMNPADS